MDHTTALGKQTAELHSLILAHPKIGAHPKGYSKYILRYRTNCGHEIAVEKRKGRPRLYFTQAVADGRLADLNPEVVLASTKGRNSNLNAMETFRNKPLARLDVTTLETVRKAFDACVSR